MRLLVVALLLVATPAALAGYFQYFDKFHDLKDDDVIECIAEEIEESCGEDVLREIRDKFADIVSTNCEQCEPEEREELIKYFVKFTRKYAEASKKIQDRYDPEREYRRKFGDYWTKKGIVLY